MFTSNESKTIRFLMVSFDYYSINEIAKECNLSPNGAYKILKKLEKQDILNHKEISKIKAYKINFENPLILSYLEIAIMDERINIPKIKVINHYLENMKKICKACVLFGSYITNKEKPNDIDILFVFDKKKYREYSKELEQVKILLTYKIHDMIQTEEDFVKNIKNKKEAVLDIIKNGVVLWGHELIARSVKNVQTR